MRIGYRLSKELFPYPPHWLDHRGIRVHYVDEGSGRPILFLHGNPTSSFLYRGLIERLRSSFRCVPSTIPGSASPTGRNQNTATPPGSTLRWSTRW